MKSLRIFIYAIGMLLVIGNALASVHTQFIAMGESGVILKSLDDGNNWEAVYNPNPRNSIYGMTFNESKYFGVGDNGSLIISTDGINWNYSENGLGTDQKILGIVTGSKGEMVAVGEKGLILSSNDGVKWKFHVSHTLYNLRSVSSGMSGVSFIAVGDNGTILTSEDGEQWSIKNVSNNVLNSVNYNGRVFVIVGDNGTILTSIDGSNWTKQPSPTSEDLLGVVYGSGAAGEFLAVGSNGTIISTHDFKFAESWVKNPFSNTSSLNSVTYGNGEFVVVGENGLIANSQDGFNWNIVDSETKIRFTNVVAGFLNNIPVYNSCQIICVVK